MGNQDRTSSSAIANGKQMEVAVLAGGCFWGVEEILTPKLVTQAAGSRIRSTTTPITANRGTLKQSV